MSKQIGTKKDENLFWASSSSKNPRALIGWLGVRGHHRAQEGLMTSDQEKARLVGEGG